MILVSSCLLGIRAKYDGSQNTVEALLDLCRQGLVVPVCPEQLGGFSTPRPPVELRGEGGGEAVLNGQAIAVNENGVDITEGFIEGARQTLRVARLFGATAAILKERSPSCGVHLIYDGAFAGNRIEGQGVAAALLRREGIPIYSEEDLTEELLEKLAKEASAPFARRSLPTDHASTV
ncbi:DUF523 domain-containing protein [Heliobacterium gestii]|uniref:DUF523 domain-containing protein n=1 Tax=Heliomicrobium gestii TaxID=2699 RepID=A0A845L6C9_HELGE|nr:DUF523 domain-containing protein [Heliomicrobium gestii]MBM7866788.1 uncharacterized protein YbbK (DUF523 family) [Heliomicrobium gestii]MZP42217.1 DUF523 domain-containing protein [Heliomicrobium gestii]